MSKIVIAEKTYKWVERCDELNAELAKVKKQLAIAVKALKYIYDDTKKGHIQCDSCGYCSSCETCINADWAEKALKDLEELEK